MSEEAMDTWKEEELGDEACEDKNLRLGIWYRCYGYCAFVVSSADVD